MQTILGLEVHPDADLFPLMEGAEFDAFVEDIRANGLREPIVLYKDKILDGRNRALALDVIHPMMKTIFNRDALKEVTVNAVLDGTTPAEYVASLNMHRRHLTAAQRKKLAGELAIRIEAEQKDKAEKDKIDSLTAAAKLAKVSRATAARGKAETKGKPQPSAKPKSFGTFVLPDGSRADGKPHPSATKTIPAPEAIADQLGDVPTTDENIEDGEWTPVVVDLRSGANMLPPLRQVRDAMRIVILQRDKPIEDEEELEEAISILEWVAEEAQQIADALAPVRT